MKWLLSPVFAIATIFSACRDKADGDLSFDLDSFKHQTLSSADAQKLSTGDLLLGRPGTLRLHPEGFVVINDALSTTRQISIIDLRDGSLEQFISKGRGPLEVMSARDPDIFDGDVWVSGRQEGKMIRLKLDRNRRKFEAVEEFDLSAVLFYRALPFAKSEFLIMNGGRSETRMTLVTDKGDSIRSAGSFPPVKVAPGVQLMNGLVQSTITVSPDRRHTAIACQTVDYIDIYDRNLELSKRLRGPIGAEPEFLMQEVQNGMFVLTQEPRFDVFGPCVSGDDGFLVVYKGDEVKTRENPEKEAHTILSFDWNGKPLKCYSFDHPVWCFDVDAEGKKMYVATRDPESLEPEILIYNL